MNNDFTAIKCGYFSVSFIVVMLSNFKFKYWSTDFNVPLISISFFNYYLVSTLFGCPLTKTVTNLHRHLIGLVLILRHTTNNISLTSWSTKVLKKEKNNILFYLIIICSFTFVEVLIFFFPILWKISHT